MVRVLLEPVRTSACVVAEPSIGVESTICSAGAASIASSSASRKPFSSASRSLPCKSKRTRYGGSDLASVKAAMSHSRITTKERYLHARSASERADRVTRALGTV
jgi:hypothetical protein